MLHLLGIVVLLAHLSGCTSVISPVTIVMDKPTNPILNLYRADEPKGPQA